MNKTIALNQIDKKIIVEVISIFDIFKIGVGPSSSHTLGPWKAALAFSSLVDKLNFDKINVFLYGSLSKTGKGHATDIAIQLGLMGYQPETITTQTIPEILSKIERTQQIKIGKKTIAFSPKDDIIFTNKERTEHPNTLTFELFNQKDLISTKTYISVGGGFIQEVGKEEQKDKKSIPYPIQTATELQQQCIKLNAPISKVVWLNEIHNESPELVDKKIEKIFDTMKNTVVRGLTTEGILPGGLNVSRRAKELSLKLLNGKVVQNFEELQQEMASKEFSFSQVTKWVSCFALAVNEENAALGRVVTSPTNGAAGVIPAVLLYYYFFCDHIVDNDIRNFFCVAGEIGALFKKGATISAAMGGCQAEIGVSSAMAAAGLTEILGGSIEQVLMAAEIAMEHHLGLTCDPVGGLVQIPCIERNALGAMKAITAAHLAIESDASKKVVDLDVVIKAMWDTAVSMNSRFKETAEGGLAIKLKVIQPEC